LGQAVISISIDHILFQLLPRLFNQPKNLLYVIYFYICTSCELFLS